MATRDQDEWDPYLGEILALMDQMPEGTHVGNKDKTEVQTLRTRLHTAQDGLDAAEKVTGFAHATLNGVIGEIDAWASKVLPSVIGQFGPGSPEDKQTPRKKPARHGGGATSSRAMNTSGINVPAPKTS